MSKRFKDRSEGKGLIEENVIVKEIEEEITADAENAEVIKLNCKESDDVKID